MSDGELEAIVERRPGCREHALLARARSRRGVEDLGRRGEPGIVRRRPGRLLGEEVGEHLAKARAVSLAEELPKPRAAARAARLVDHRRRAMHVDRTRIAQARPPRLPQRHREARVDVDRREEALVEPADAERRLAPEHEARRARVVDGARLGGRRRVHPAPRTVGPDDRAVLRRAVAQQHARGDRAGVRALAQRLQQPRGTARVQLGVLVDDADMLGARVAQREVPAADDADVVAVVEDSGPARPVRRQRARVRAHLVVGVVEHEQQLGLGGLRRDRPDRDRWRARRRA